jgi:DNA-directed RNA polymerase beta' subunit
MRATTQWSGFNADFDGDQMAVHCRYLKKQSNQGKCLPE